MEFKKLSGKNWILKNNLKNNEAFQPEVSGEFGRAVLTQSFKWTGTGRYA